MAAFQDSRPCWQFLSHYTTYAVYRLINFLFVCQACTTVMATCFSFNNLQFQVSYFKPYMDCKIKCVCSEYFLILMSILSLLWAYLCDSLFANHQKTGFVDCNIFAHDFTSSLTAINAVKKAPLKTECALLFPSTVWAVRTELSSIQSSPLF